MMRKFLCSSFFPFGIVVLSLGSLVSADENTDANARLVQEIRQAVELDASTISKLEKALEDSEQAIIAWKASSNGKRLIELEKEMKVAAKRKDLGAVRNAVGEAKPLRAEYIAVIRKSKERIKSALSPEQQSKWQTSVLSGYFLELAAPLKLTDDQKAQIQDSAAKAIATDKPRPGQFVMMEKQVESDILTKAQREAFQKIKDQNKLRSLKAPEM